MKSSFEAGTARKTPPYRYQAAPATPATDKTHNKNADMIDS
jgi:hypothetical protein